MKLEKLGRKGLEKQVNHLTEMMRVANSEELKQVLMQQRHEFEKALLSENQ